MNISAAINKLQMALLVKNIQVKLNTKQAYIEENNKMVTKYILTTQMERISKNGELYMKDETIYETYSKAQLIKFLYRAYKEGGVPFG